MNTVVLKSSDWTSGPVGSAETFLERWRGLKALPAGSSLLVRASSVHGLGIREPFQALGLTADMEVAALRVVAPRRVANFPGCAWVLELPLGASTPAIGSHLEVRHV